MKINISENELKEITSNMIDKVLRETIEEGKTKKFNKDGYLKASRSGSRDAEKEIKGDGFKAVDKVHKSPKDYNRKGKNQNSWKNEIDESVEPIGTPYRVSKILWGLDIQGPNGTSTIYARKIKDFGVFLNSQLNAENSSLHENEENELTYKTAMNARDAAVNSAHKELRINGSYDNDSYLKKINQIDKFGKYPMDMLKKLINTKVEVLLSSNEHSNDTMFYNGIIKDIKEIKPHIYNFTTILSPTFGDKKNTKVMNIIVNLKTSTFNSDGLTLDGDVEESGQYAQFKLSNKKGRHAVASLINHKGTDEFIKPF